jgi:hypothetical protein
VAVDCSGLTETLFESELFGYERGAFTGAAARKAGLVETAKGGTLFLDEIGDVPLATQVKLLRLIESGTYRRAGGAETLQADFRLVAATHKPLRDMAAKRRFARTCTTGSARFRPTFHRCATGAKTYRFWSSRRLRAARASPASAFEARHAGQLSCGAGIARRCGFRGLCEPLQGITQGTGCRAWDE